MMTALSLKPLTRWVCYWGFTILLALPMGAMGREATTEISSFEVLKQKAANIAILLCNRLQSYHKTFATNKSLLEYPKNEIENYCKQAISVCASTRSNKTIEEDIQVINEQAKHIEAVVEKGREILAPGSSLIEYIEYDALPVVASDIQYSKTAMNIAIQLANSSPDSLSEEEYDSLVRQITTIGNHLLPNCAPYGAPCTEGDWTSP